MSIVKLDFFDYQKKFSGSLWSLETMGAELMWRCDWLVAAWGGTGASIDFSPGMSRSGAFMN